ncbi:Gfo/Idh/MocA family protein [Pectobacterium aquaticum]|uniref:Gfo/Idh/MocA family oxidoreductase n=1 Tax=Pectobacterium aquaticum TaxID=2204145 RepID=A0AA93DN03_9GAMM|nr:Gfo/Idh/MocA family oxidoreductase [Pectobacterium aquaticum]RRO02309.1 Gfo/Idh/MocA family oxidoreductase [Pectobacterium aquaticum]RRO07577.1 Gfo/Idh/MocA family oxidoreductase [Pectobacterium aquaticum]RRO16487.1 Gfo/Idh/MocA family oxidoreductase [Pectobacterium aquaticum]
MKTDNKQHPVLKLGFIGGGLNSAIGVTHQIASQMDGRFELVSGCFSRDDIINNETAKKWGVSSDRVYNNQYDFLESESERLDAVVILTPTPTHSDTIVRCLEKRLPIICEKALVSTVDEVDRVHHAINDMQGRLAVTFNYTGYPMVRELRERICNEELGKIKQVMVEMPQEGFLRHSNNGKVSIPQEWRQKDGSIPTVSLDLGVHVHQLVSFLTNEKPLDVFAINSTFGEIANVIDTVNCLANYSNGIVCNYWYGKAALGYRNGLRIRIMGSKGSAEWLQMEPEYLYMSDLNGGSRLVDRTHPENSIANQLRYSRFKAGHPAGFIEAFANYYADIADSLLGASDKYVFGVDTAREGIHFLHHANNSAKAGLVVKLLN